MDTAPSPSAPVGCCSAPPEPASPLAVATLGDARADLVRRAFRLEYLTAGWMVLEAAVAVWRQAEIVVSYMAGPFWRAKVMKVSLAGTEVAIQSAGGLTLVRGDLAGMPGRGSCRGRS